MYQVYQHTLSNKMIPGLTDSNGTNTRSYIDQNQAARHKVPVGCLG